MALHASMYSYIPCHMILHNTSGDSLISFIVQLTETNKNYVISGEPKKGMSNKRDILCIRMEPYLHSVRLFGDTLW